MEYYGGILFLTTNRIGKIDQAISSRLHLILHYKRLRQPEIENVFRINIDRLQKLEEQQAKVSGLRPLVVVQSDLLQFAADHCSKHPDGKGAWNGRQIRNAFLIAAGIARDEAEQQQADFQPQLRYSHFKQVEKLFEEYIQFRLRVIGKDDAQQALLNEERDDDFESEQHEDQKPGWHPMMNRRQTLQQSHPPGFPRQMHTSNPAAHQPPDFGPGFPMSPYGHELQSANSWRGGADYGREHASIPPDVPFENGRSHGAHFPTVQRLSTMDQRAGGLHLPEYGQHPARVYNGPMTDNPPMQPNPIRRMTESPGQEDYSRGMGFGGFARQTTRDNMAPEIE